MSKNGFIRHDFKIETDNNINFSEFKAVLANALSASKAIHHTKEPFIVAEEIQPQKVIWRVYFWIETPDFQKSFYHLKGNVVEDIQELMIKKGYWKSDPVQ